MTTPYRAIPLDEILAEFSPERRARIEAETADLIAVEHALAHLRRARKKTQEEIAAILGGNQVLVSRLEKRSDAKISTLKRYVQALGGELHLVATFPGERPVPIGGLGDTPPRPRKKRRAA